MYLLIKFLRNSDKTESIWSARCCALFALSQSYANINNAGGSDFSPGTAVASAKAAEGDAKTNRRRRKILMCARQLVSIRFALSIELRSLFHFAQCAQDEETNESDPARYDIAIDSQRRYRLMQQPEALQQWSALSWRCRCGLERSCRRR